jgi:type III pantothenate kinase
MRGRKGATMLLVVNSNNTNTTFAVFNGDEKRGSWRISTDARRTADEYMVWLTQLMALEGIERGAITGTALSNVVPQASFYLRNLCQRYFGGEPLTIGDPALDYGIKILIDRPEEAGADRIANAVAAKKRHAMPAVVVDLGTATTFDVLDREGNYVGGVISPGINLAFEALYMGAAKLPRIEIKRPARAIGRGTVSAMQSGIYWGYIGLIEGLLERIQEEQGGEMNVIGTGGLVPLIAAGCPAIRHIDQDLTLRGIADIYFRNST